jgi:sugar O-acyltransferase (sialic acid O-acetyltransferase NeuD family)
MKNKEYYILGAGGLAKEVYFLAQKTLGNSSVFNGFIDFDPKFSTIDCRGKKEKVLDEEYFLKNNKPLDTIDFYMGIGDAKILKEVSKKFSEFHFPNLIYNQFFGDLDSIIMGKGNIITPGCIFTVDISIGSFNLFNLNSTIGHDTVIGDCNIFNPGCNISGSVKIGSGNLFGTNSTVLQFIEIGNDNILGASALANKNIQNESIMAGVPAKNLKK